MKQFKTFCLAVLSLGSVMAQQLSDQQGTKLNAKGEKIYKTPGHPMLPMDGPYKPTWESIDSHKTPQWFKDAKIGYSMHWGVYAVPGYAAGGFAGPSAYSEWYFRMMHVENSGIQKHHKETYGADYAYDNFIEQFTAENFDADRWMKGLADNGVKYFFITSKHHDGFCLWDTKYTDRNSVKMGPKRDILDELTKAARKHNVKIGFYYSWYEWYNPAYAAELDHKTWMGTPAELQAKVKKLGYKGYKPVKNYVDDFMVPQIVELIDKYQPDLLFFDGEWDYPTNYWRSQEIMAYYYNQAKKWGKEVLTNDRFGKGTRGKKGDMFHVEYSANIDKNLPWAMWRGFGNSFGYNSNETKFLTPKGAIEMTANCVATNGNIEFNVGPTLDGRIAETEWGLTKAMGTWLKENGEAIYGAVQSPVRKPSFGVVTHQPAKKTLYLHVFDWPRIDGKLRFKGILNKVTKAYSLGDKNTLLKVNQSEKGLKEIQLVETGVDTYVTVIALEYEGDLKTFDYIDYVKASKGTFNLTAKKATLKGKRFKVVKGSKAIEYWSNKNDYALWGVDVKEKGKYQVKFDMACPSSHGGTLDVLVDGKKVLENIAVPHTSQFQDYKTFDFGTIKLKKGKHKVEVKINQLNKALMNLRAVKFVKQ